MANLITLFRFPLLFIYVGILYFGNATLQLWGVVFILIIIVMDTVDGLIARARGEVSLLGSVLDIATDRTLEVVLWVVFAHLQAISIIIPIIIIVRGTTVDAIRSVGMSKGLPPFEQLQSKIARVLVSTQFMRGLYGTIKAIAFAALTLFYAFFNMNSSWAPMIHTIALIFSWSSVALSLVRGLPVLIEGYSMLHSPDTVNDQS